MRAHKNKGKKLGRKLRALKEKTKLDAKVARVRAFVATVPKVVISTVDVCNEMKRLGLRVATKKVRLKIRDGLEKAAHVKLMPTL
jgi:hypothetical protein